VPGPRPSSRLHPHPLLLLAVVGWFLLARADDVLLARGLRLAMLLIVAADVVWAVVRTRRASVRIVDQPTSAFVGDEIALDVEVTGAGRGITVGMTSSPGAPWVVAVGDGVGRLPGTANFRGVARLVTVQLRGHGPLGLVGFSHSSSLPIRPLWIAPRPVAPPAELRLGAGHGDESGPPDLGDAVPAGVREHRPGDPWRRIAWPVTARAGRLVTREYEHDAAPRLRLAIDLGEVPGAAGEQTVAVAAGIGREALRSGYRLEVLACWPAGLVDAGFGGPGVAVDAAGLHRCTAVADYGPVPLPDHGRVLVVSPGGVEWR